MSSDVGERRVTLQSIADALGVSRTTVSNAYNRPDRLSRQLQERILETARELGYAGPDPIARQLRTGQRSAVGLVLTDSLPFAFNDEAAVGFLHGLATACETAHMPLMLIPVTSDRDGGVAQIEQAAVDSMVVYSVPDRAPYVDAVLRKNIPVVVVDGPKDLPHTSWAGLDQLGSSALTAKHLADLGHREVGVLCHRLSDEPYVGHVDDERLSRATYPVQRERVIGFRDEFLRLVGDGARVHVTERRVSDIPSGRSGARAILRDFPDVTAIVCTCDALALGVLATARELGLRVPEDLSVTGFDDIPSAAGAGLTTIWQPLAEKGEVAGEMVLGNANTAASRHETLPTRLMVRETTAAARHGRVR
ncbi:LacI family DNA-binding transcriptional regulator [Isoptericola sp. b441]|uniref:LacI family DNA-binding transcriptional regulator n=1 Tax=Actinotalea lenta TaxID=3064654 RepID=A0ABT9D6Q9_9CELL|nr:LacI family DNA-binding transcriptional regulator [Isoptericola sp. b441]MDO8106522.1 LacI family DNA-binding transcriptional regulator [Isoptericola sp. b441]